jgi:hypothetical protein
MNLLSLLLGALSPQPLLVNQPPLGGLLVLAAQHFLLVNVAVNRLHVAEQSPLPAPVAARSNRSGSVMSLNHRLVDLAHVQHYLPAVGVVVQLPLVLVVAVMVEYLGFLVPFVVVWVASVLV